MRLIHGECLEEMDKLINEGVKVDLTVTSPPYDNLRTYNNSLLWNETIWKGVIERLFKITKDGGVVVWVVNDATIKGSETGTSFKQALYFKEVGFNLHDTMIWEKPNPIPTQSTRYQQGFEYMFILVKGKIKTFNPIKEKCKFAGAKVKKHRANKEGHTYNNEGTYSVKEEKITSNVWVIGNTINRYKHKAIFPESLANDHIITWSNENAIVFDPFMGSGTTGKMAVMNKRNFIGIEKDETYFNIADKRINRPDQETLFNQ